MVAALLVAFAALALVVRGPEVNALDASASAFVHSFASPIMDALMTAASAVGSGPALLVLAAATAAVALVRGRPALAAFLAVASVGVVLLNDGLKLVVARSRPTFDWAAVLPDYSYPSGHAMQSIVVLVAVAFVAWALLGRRVGIVATVVALGLALLIGLSRIYLGAHYLTDVIGGLLAGAAWLILVVWAFRAAWRRREGETATPAEGSVADHSVADSTVSSCNVPLAGGIGCCAAGPSHASVGSHAEYLVAPRDR